MAVPGTDLRLKLNLESKFNLNNFIFCCSKILYLLSFINCLEPAGGVAVEDMGEEGDDAQGVLLALVLHHLVERWRG